MSTGIFATGRSMVRGRPRCLCIQWEQVCWRICCWYERGFGVFMMADYTVQGVDYRGARHEGVENGKKHGKGLWVVGDGSSYDGIS